MRQTTLILTLLTVLLTGVGFNSTAYAQWSYGLGLTGSYDSNPLGISGATPGTYLSGTASASYHGETIGGGYSARLTGYDEPTELSSYLHQGSLSIGTNQTGIYNLVEQRIGTQSSLYDYLVLQSTPGHRFDCAEFTCRVSASGSLFRFTELTDRNQIKVIPLLSLSRSFQTRTTLIGSFGGGYTYYTDLVSDDGTPAEDPDVAQLSLSLRLAQSLASATGAAVFYQQRSIHGTTPTTIVDEESGISYALLDDPSLYNNRIIGTEITQMLLDYALAIKVGGSLSYRDYPSQGVYLENGDYHPEILREDRFTTLWMTATWNLSPNRGRIRLELAGQWSDNKSNSYWYDVSSSYLSVGLGYGL